MEMQQIRHFVAAVEHENLSRAAESFGLSQPALTRSIHNLESMLGVTLLERGPFGVRPTSFGELLFEHAQVILNEVRQTISSISAMKSGAIGQVAVGVTPDCAGDLLPQAIALTHRRLPELKIRVREGWMEDLLPRLQVAELDLVVGPKPGDILEHGLTATPLTVHKFPIVVRKDHPFPVGDLTTLEMLAVAKWIMPDQIQARAAFAAIFTKANLDAPEPLISATSLSCTIRMLCDDDYVAMIPLALITKELQSGDLRILKTDRPVVERQVALHTRSRGFKTPAVRCFIESIVATCNESSDRKGQVGSQRLGSGRHESVN